MDPSLPAEVVSLLEKAVKAFGEGRYEEARAAYSQAYKLDPQTRTLMELAVAEFKSDHPVEAAAHWKEYLQRPDATVELADAVRKHWLMQAQSQIAHLDIHVPPKAEVIIDGSAPDGHPVSEGEGGREVSLTIDVREGNHEVTAQRGSANQVRHIVARGGEHVQVRLLLDQQDTPATPAPTPGPPATREVPENGVASTRWPWVIGLGSIALVAAGIGTGFAVAFVSAGVDAAKLVPAIAPSSCLQMPLSQSCTQVQHDRSQQRNDLGLATGFYVGAGIAGVSAITTWLLWPGPAASRSGSAIAWRALPLVDSRTAGLAVDRVW
jgi:hypothetical protein